MYLLKESNRENILVILMVLVSILHCQWMIYFKENLEMVEKLAEELEFEMPESKKESTVDLTGMTFVVTGKVNKFANRYDDQR